MWPNEQFPADLVTFTEEILSGKVHFLCSAGSIAEFLLIKIENKAHSLYLQNSYNLWHVVIEVRYLLICDERKNIES